MVTLVVEQKITNTTELDTLLSMEETAYMDTYCADSVMYHGKILNRDEMLPPISLKCSMKYNKGIYNGFKWSYCKKKNGQYKYRTFLPNSYTSAKSVIRNAIEQGQSLIRDGMVLGKTEVQKSLSSSKKKDFIDIALKCALKLRQIYPDLNAPEQEQIDRILSNLAGD